MLRFSGHETFPCRYSWIPKAYEALACNPHLFRDEAEAMVELGVGKNMVRAIRFWIRAAKIHTEDNGLVPTELGKAIFAKDGIDPYMEDIKTNWIIHWNIANISKNPLFAWRHVFNHWHHPEFTRTELESTFFTEASTLDRPLSKVTTDQHVDVFLRTYIAKGVGQDEAIEDSLDCPLAELRLIKIVGERSAKGSKQREPVYSFRYEEKEDISSNLFVFFINDFWSNNRANEKTITLHDLAYAELSPGQLLKIPEQSIRNRLENIEKNSGGAFSFDDSSTVQRIVKNKNTNRIELLYAAYGQ